MNPDLFKFRYTDPKFTKMRCFLGNGYQSTEISNNLGQGAGTTDFTQAPFPIMRLAGVYSYPSTVPDEKRRKELMLDTLFRALNTFTIYPLDPDNPAHPSPADLDFYMPSSFEQVLDARRAVVTTKAKVEALELETEVFLSRTQPNFGVMRIKVSKSSGSQFSFQHVTRKDPYTCLDQVTCSEIGPGKMLWETAVRDDNYEFHKKGLYHVAQGVGIDVFDEKNKPLKFTVVRTAEDEGSLDFNDMPSWKATFHCDAPKASKDKKYRWIIVVYFGIYKQSDNETPRFAGAPADDVQGKRAIAGMDQVMEAGYDRLLKAHEAAWQADIWQGMIEVPGADDEIQRRIISSFYVLGCTYLEGLAYGNGPNGINGHWWAGRTFWDHDLWVNLGMILWAPGLARNFNSFRFNALDGALENRKLHVALLKRDGILDKYGLKIMDGAKYPWESTTSGLERCPGGQTHLFTQEHVVCDVMYGMWLQHVVTQDRQFLEKVAFPVAYQCALYLGQRVRKEADGKWHYRWIQCADEFAEHKDDNAFTNLYVEICMRFIIDWCKLLRKDYPKHWDDISENMKYHFDVKAMRILEHETYMNESIKQADTDLITWPLEHPAVYGIDGETIRRNNMLFYFAHLPEGHIMMSACIFSIIALELGMQEKGWEYFSDQFPHFHPDLSYIPSESPSNDCWPFITGIGGFLSNLVYGFGGIRIRPDGLLFSPRLESRLPRLVIPRIKFQGMELSYEVYEGGREFTLINRSTAKQFTIYGRNGRLYRPKNIAVVDLLDVEGRTEKKYRVLLPKDERVTFVLAP